MNAIKLAAGIGMAWLAVWAGHAQAFDWNVSYETIPVGWHKTGTNTDAKLLVSHYNWDRSVQMWQSIKNPVETTLSGISLQIRFAKGNGGKSSTFDFNVYEGYGVMGRLVASNKVDWNQPFAGGWYGFKLNVLQPPLVLLKDATYTFSIENLLPEDSLGIVIDTSSSRIWNAGYMQQGYFGMTDGPRGYNMGGYDATVNYILWK